MTEELEIAAGIASGAASGGPGRSAPKNKPSGPAAIIGKLLVAVRRWRSRLLAGVAVQA